MAYGVSGNTAPYLRAAASPEKLSQSVVVVVVDIQERLKTHSRKLALIKTVYPGMDQNSLIQSMHQWENKNKMCIIHPTSLKVGVNKQFIENKFVFRPFIQGRSIVKCYNQYSFMGSRPIECFMTNDFRTQIRGIKIPQHGDFRNIPIYDVSLINSEGNWQIISLFETYFDFVDANCFMCFYNVVFENNVVKSCQCIGFYEDQIEEVGRQEIFCFNLTVCDEHIQIIQQPGKTFKDFQTQTAFKLSPLLNYSTPTVLDMVLFSEQHDPNIKKLITNIERRDLPSNCFPNIPKKKTFTFSTCSFTIFNFTNHKIHVIKGGINKEPFLLCINHYVMGNLPESNTTMIIYGHANQELIVNIESVCDGGNCAESIGFKIERRFTRAN